MSMIRLALGAVLVIAGLLFGAILIWQGLKRYGSENRHSFSIRNMVLKGWRRPWHDIPALELLANGLASIVAAWLIHSIVFGR